MEVVPSCTEADALHQLVHPALSHCALIATNDFLHQLGYNGYWLTNYPAVRMCINRNLQVFLEQCTMRTLNGVRKGIFVSRSSPYLFSNEPHAESASSSRAYFR